MRAKTAYLWVVDINRDGLLIGLLVFFFFLAVMFAAAEMGLARVSDVRVRTMAEEGHRRARRLLVLLETLPRVINAILLAVLVVQIGAATITGLLAERWFSNFGIVVASIVLTILLFVYTEAIPKTYAFRHPTSVALALTYPVALLEFLLRPVVKGLVWFADLHAPGKGVSMAPTITERELLSLAADAEQEGEITSVDRLLIERAFRLGDRTAEEVMVPRTDIVGVPASVTIDAAVTVALEAGHRRLIVYEDDLDRITGVVNLRDLVRATGTAPSSLVKTLAGPALIVSEWKRVIDLLRDMQAQGTHLAVVVDEFGSAIGILTMEDVFEEVVGEIDVGYDFDEYQPKQKVNIEHESEISHLMSGRTPISEVNDILYAKFPVEEAHTIGGLIVSRLKHIPEQGDFIEEHGYRLTVLEADARSILKVRLEHLA